VDADYIVSAVAVGIIVLNGLTLFLVFSARDKIGTLGKRLDTQTQRITRLTEWLEGQGKAKRKTKDDDPNAKT
jgi:predicted component of type VI protein secretion system